jgi:hypothetical protein
LKRNNKLCAERKARFNMAQLKNAMELYKLLDRSNCRKCGKPTCLAFAVAVIQGQTRLDECPALDKAVIEEYGGDVVKQVPFDERQFEAIEELKKKIATIDLASAAKRLGAEFRDNKLTVKCLGKDFSVDTKGDIITAIHVNSWIAIPVLNYIMAGEGVPASGKWVPFRELKGGKSWYQLFERRCEKPLQKVADTYTDLFEDMIRLFNGKQVENHYSSDISLVLHPLPKVPLLISYWKPAGRLEPDLTIFFDRAADKNLNIENIYTLATGLVVMFEKLASRHS